MTRLKVKIVQLTAMVGLLIAGVGVSVALAGNGNGPHSSPPGQGECSHGNSGKECRSDPQPEHGQDCEEHGQYEGGVNEDHCYSTTSTIQTTTTTTTTDHPCTRAHPCPPEVCEEVGAHGDDCLPPQTTTTPPCEEVESEGDDCRPPQTTTTPPPPGCGVAGKDGKPGNDDCATTSTTTPKTSTTSTTTPTTSSTTTTTTSVLGTTTTSESSGAAPGASVAKPQQGVKGQVATAAAGGGQLPFTGFPAWILAIAGSLLLVSGLGMRRFATKNPTD
jgi:hypothetical protein